MIDLMIRYESGELSDKETLQLFSQLIKSGDVWRLQGHYGRAATALINDLWLTPEGDLTEKAIESGLD